jgi:hypothetical protein
VEVPYYTIVHEESIHAEFDIVKKSVRGRVMTLVSVIA